MQTPFKANHSYGLFTLLFITLFSSCKKDTEFTQDGNPLITENSAIKKAPATLTVLYTGLNNPRGLKFGPDGNLYVAEAVKILQPKGREYSNYNTSNGKYVGIVTDSDILEKVGMQVGVF